MRVVVIAVCAVHVNAAVFATFSNATSTSQTLHHHRHHHHHHPHPHHPHHHKHHHKHEEVEPPCEQDPSTSTGPVASNDDDDEPPSTTSSGTTQTQTAFANTPDILATRTNGGILNGDDSSSEKAPDTETTAPDTEDVPDSVPDLPGVPEVTGLTKAAHDVQTGISGFYGAYNDLSGAKPTSSTLPRANPNGAVSITSLSFVGLSVLIAVTTVSIIC